MKVALKGKMVSSLPEVQNANNCQFFFTNPSEVPETSIFFPTFILIKNATLLRGWEKMDISFLFRGRKLND